uniref:hypothetical protein n=1 Tax=Mycolicibacterium vanbaalenii TaxID=110539 RepID=UPI0021F263A9|nr:hypothetical protein [Mycolicibacterium vanbaalenii]
MPTSICSGSSIPISDNQSGPPGRRRRPGPVPRQPPGTGHRVRWRELVARHGFHLPVEVHGDLGPVVGLQHDAGDVLGGFRRSGTVDDDHVVPRRGCVATVRQPFQPVPVRGRRGHTYRDLSRIVQHGQLAHQCPHRGTHRLRVTADGDHRGGAQRNPDGHTCDDRAVPDQAAQCAGGDGVGLVVGSQFRCDHGGRRRLFSHTDAHHAEVGMVVGAFPHPLATGERPQRRRFGMVVVQDADLFLGRGREDFVEGVEIAQVGGALVVEFCGAAGPAGTVGQGSDRRHQHHGREEQEHRVARRVR